MSNTTKQVILNSPTNQELWLFIVKTIADRGDVWKYINPDLPQDPAVPPRPVKPTPDLVNADKLTILDLDLVERETYKLLLADYKEELVVVKQIHDSLQAVRTHIVTTVSATNISYIDDKPSIYQMLLALKKRLAPTDYARKLDVVTKYNKLKIFGKSENTKNQLKN